MKMTFPTNPQPLRTPALGVLLALSFAVMAGCTGQANEAPQPPPPQVSVAPVEVREISQWDDFSGRVEAIESVDLRPRVSGYIDSVDYREGQEVEQGAVLFTIDSRSYRAALDRAEAELARARSQAELGRSEAARALALSQSQAISTEVYEQRRAAAAEAAAGVKAAQAAVDAARLDLEFTRVRAPIGGRAGRALVTTGNLVTAGDGASVLTTLVSLERMHVHFDIDESTFLRYAGLARQGQRPSENGAGVPVQVGLVGEDGFPYTGIVDFLDNRVDSATGTIRARAVLDNAGGALTPGMFARVRVLGSGRFDAVLIDEKAVLTDQDRKYVYVVDGEGLAQRRDIELGRPAEGLRIVSSGLADGDRVIVNGVQKVFFPGMPVNPVVVAMDGSPVPSAAPATASLD